MMKLTRTPKEAESFKHVRVTYTHEIDIPVGTMIDIAEANDLSAPKPDSFTDEVFLKLVKDLIGSKVSDVDALSDFIYEYEWYGEIKEADIEIVTRCSSE